MSPRRRIFGIGVDIAHIPRIQKIYDRYGDRFLQRAFNENEIQEVKMRSKRNVGRYLASRWAVKEAVFKAFGKWRLPFPEISVSTSPCEVETCSDQVHGPIPNLNPLCPKLLFHGKVLQLAKSLNVNDSHVSISHDGEYAIAFVILEEKK